MTLLGLQTATAFIWTVAMALPFWIGPFGASLGSVMTVFFALAVTGLGAYRYVALGEVRHRVFGALPAFVRAIFVAAPFHAVHGTVTGLFAALVTWSQPTQVRDEEEKEEIVRHAFLMYFLLGWTFSSLFLLEKRQQLTFGRLSHKTRLQSLMSRAPTVALNVAVMNVLGAIYQTWSPLWVAVTVTLELSDAVFGTLLTERSRLVDFDRDTAVLASSLQVVEGNPIVEAFQALPLIVQQNGEWQPRYSWLFSRMPAVPDVTQLAAWWSAKRSENALGASITANISPNVLVSLSKERFDTITQVVYRCESLCEGSVFAKGKHSMWFPREAFRIRAFGLLAACPADLSFANVSDWIAAVNACLDTLDAGTVRILAFCRMAAPEQEPPRNQDTGLDETNVYFTNKVEEDESSAAKAERKREAASKAWDERNKRFTSGMWWRRQTLGNIIWNFDPVYEEIRRSKGLTNQDLPGAVKRDAEKALLDEFNLLCRASEAAVCLATKKKPAGGFQGNVTVAVETTLSRCLAACDEAEGVFEDMRMPHDFLYALQFCLDRDLQLLKG